RHTTFSRDWSSDVCSSDLSKGDVTIGGDTGPAQASVNGLIARTNGRRAQVNIGADTSAAEWALAAFLGRPRYMTIQTRVAGVGRSEERRGGKEGQSRAPAR